MKVDINDRPQRRDSQAMWRPYVAAVAVSALLSGGMIYLYSTGWGVNIDLQKLREAFVVSGKAEVVSRSNELAKENTKAARDAETKRHQITNGQKKEEKHSEHYMSPKGMPPVDWSIHVRAFNRVFIQHASCNPHNMKWTQMECSNFRARAMKRFGVEWKNGAYWNGKIIVENKVSNDKVNSELTW